MERENLDCIRPQDPPPSPNDLPFHRTRRTIYFASLQQTLKQRFNNSKKYV